MGEGGIVEGVLENYMKWVTYQTRLQLFIAVSI